MVNKDMSIVPGPIGIFDSGYGGLTILDKIRNELPEYDYIYLGDNARTPYGTRSFDVVYQYTSESVKKFFDMGCHLVILGCNTASAKALRSIQQYDLPLIDKERRVLGVIRPTVEVLDQVTVTKHVGMFATPGTVKSDSYRLEIQKLFPSIRLTSEACPMWVPLIENNEHLSPGADYFVRQHIDNLLRINSEIDTIILGCTHYPLILPTILKFLPKHIRVITQGEIVAKSLRTYLDNHPEMQVKCTTKGSVTYYTTETVEKFASMASIFLKEHVSAINIQL